EQSGHVIFLDSATTGDGILTALQLLSRVAATGATLAELAAVVHRLPQVLLNVTVADKAAAAAAPEVAAAVAAAEAELGDAGRGLARGGRPRAAPPIGPRGDRPGDGGSAHRGTRRAGRAPAGRGGEPVLATPGVAQGR